MSGKCNITPHTGSFSDSSLLYLHTGNPMPGISRPILWKASPTRTEIAIISECNEAEQSLAHLYLQISPDSTYIPPAVPDICALAIKVVQVLEQLHLKRVRHGSLRP